MACLHVVPDSSEGFWSGLPRDGIVRKQGPPVKRKAEA